MGVTIQNAKGRRIRAPMVAFTALDNRIGTNSVGSSQSSSRSGTTNVFAVVSPGGVIRVWCSRAHAGFESTLTVREEHWLMLTEQLTLLYSSETLAFDGKNVRVGSGAASSMVILVEKSRMALTGLAQSLNAVINVPRILALLRPGATGTTSKDEDQGLSRKVTSKKRLHRKLLIPQWRRVVSSPLC